MKFLVGIISIAFGVLISLKSEWFLHNVGRMPSIEKYLGTFGGTRLFYQILGVLIICIATLYMTGALSGIGMAIIGGLFKR